MTRVFLYDAWFFGFPKQATPKVEASITNRMLLMSTIIFTFGNVQDMHMSSRITRKVGTASNGNC